MSREATEVNRCTWPVGISQGPGVVEGLCNLAAVQIHTGRGASQDAKARNHRVLSILCGLVTAQVHIGSILIHKEQGGSIHAQPSTQVLNI